MAAAVYLTVLASDRHNAARLAAGEGAAGGTGCPPPRVQAFNLVFWEPDGTKRSETVRGPAAAHRRFFELEADGRTVHIEEAGGAPERAQHRAGG